MSMRRVTLMILAIVGMSFAIDKSSPPYTFTAGTKAVAAQVNANFDTLDAKVDQLVDTVSRAYVRFSPVSTTHDSVVKYVRIDSVRSNTDIDSIQGGKWWTTTQLVVSDSAFIDTLAVGVVSGAMGIGTTSPEGKLHVYGGSAGTVTASALSQVTIESNGYAGISILTPNSSEGNILFGDPQDNDVGKIAYIHSTNGMDFTVNGSSAMQIFYDGTLYGTKLWITDSAFIDTLNSSITKATWLSVSDSAFIDTLTTSIVKGTWGSFSDSVFIDTLTTTAGNISYFRTPLQTKSVSGNATWTWGSDITSSAVEITSVNATTDTIRINNGTSLPGVRMALVNTSSTNCAIKYQLTSGDSAVAILQGVATGPPFNVGRMTTGWRYGL